MDIDDESDAARVVLEGGIVERRDDRWSAESVMVHAPECG